MEKSAATDEYHETTWSVKIIFPLQGSGRGKDFYKFLCYNLSIMKTNLYHWHHYYSASGGLVFCGKKR